MFNTASHNARSLWIFSSLIPSDAFDRDVVGFSSASGEYHFSGSSTECPRYLLA
jgi:hypothetical protein